MIKYLGITNERKPAVQPTQTSICLCASKYINEISMWTHPSAWTHNHMKVMFKDDNLVEKCSDIVSVWQSWPTVLLIQLNQAGHMISDNLCTWIFNGLILNQTSYNLLEIVQWKESVIMIWMNDGWVNRWIESDR